MKTRIEQLLSDALGYDVDMKPKRLTKRERIERDIEVLRERQLQRISRGRTRGAGAGGFNRDVDNIVHQIRLLEYQLESN
jgi:hypothetical protein